MLKTELEPYKEALEKLYRDAGRKADDAMINNDRTSGRIIIARRVTDPANSPYRISLIDGNTVWGIDIKTLETTKTILK